MFSSTKQNETTSILNDMGHKVFLPLRKECDKAGQYRPSSKYGPLAAMTFGDSPALVFCDSEELKSMTPSTSGESPSRDASEFGILPAPCLSSLEALGGYAGEPLKHKFRKTTQEASPQNARSCEILSFEQTDFLKNFKFIKLVSETLKGAVFQVECRKTGKGDLALKYTSKKSKGKSGFSCFEDPQREFELLKSLQQGDAVSNLKQNNIIPAWEFAEDEDCFCTVMDLAQCDLFEVVKTHGCLQESQARSIFKQICRALQFLKSKRICHLDVSLENVLMDREGNCFLSDFGLAQEVLHGSSEFLGPDYRPGKPKYMAPEIVKGELFNGYEADMYSLGIVLFCMLYGFHPYQSPSYDEPGYVLISCGFTEQLLFSIDDISISDEAQDLICNLLCPEAVRYTLEEVLLHEWLRS